MLLTHSLPKTSVKLTFPRAVKTETPRQAEGDSFLKSAGDKALGLIKKVGKAAKPYVSSGLIAAAPAIATTVALALGGAPAAGLAILGSGLVGAVAGVAAWGKDIGIIRAASGGGLTGMFSAGLGALGGGIGIVNMAAIGATREAILRHVADVPKT